jgi:hypothetical protein
LRLFAPQALRFGPRNIHVLLKHEGVFHSKLVHARAGLSRINQHRSNELKALPCPVALRPQPDQANSSKVLSSTESFHSFISYCVATKPVMNTAPSVSISARMRVRVTMSWSVQFDVFRPWDEEPRYVPTNRWMVNGWLNFWVAAAGRLSKTEHSPRSIIRVAPFFEPSF